MTERRVGSWTIGAIACGVLSVVARVLAVGGGGLGTALGLLLLSAVLFVTGTIAAIVAVFRRQRGGLVVAGVFGLIIAIGAARQFSRTHSEQARVDRYVALVGQHLATSPTLEISEKWGRFLRFEGSGYEYPPFMSPGGDYFIATRTAHFERGSTSIKIYVPGLTDKSERFVPGFGIEPQGNVIVARF